MKLTEVFDILAEKSSYYQPGYDEKKGNIQGSVQEWMQLHGITKEDQKETVRKALEELKKTRAWQVAESMGLRFISTDRELNFGTLAFETGISESDMNQNPITNARGENLIYVYNIYGNGQIRTYKRSKSNQTNRWGITRLKSPKPAMVLNNPVKSLAKTWENSLLEVNTKFKEKLDKVEKIYDKRNRPN